MLTDGNFHPDLGKRLADIRKKKKISLTEASRLSGISRSTLYKVENSGVMLTYGKLVDLARGLHIDVTELFREAADDDQASQVKTRQAIGQYDDGDVVETKNYQYIYLASALRGKRMIPTTIRLKARTMEEFGELITHPGEEFTIVLSGTVRVVTEHYKDALLEQGAVMYMDSSMPHAYLKASEDDAVVVTVCSVDPRSTDDAGTFSPESEDAD